MDREDDIINGEVIENSQEDFKEKVIVGELLDEVQSDIDAMQSNINRKFEDKKNALLMAQNKFNNHFISKNDMWDMWFQKLFAQMISIKVWVMVLITVLLVLHFINSIEFASLFGIIMGFKGAFAVAEVWKTKASDIENKSIFKRV